MTTVLEQIEADKRIDKLKEMQAKADKGNLEIAALRARVEENNKYGFKQTKMQAEITRWITNTYIDGGGYDYGDETPGFWARGEKATFDLVPESKICEIRNALNPSTGDTGGFLIAQDFGEQLEFFLQQFDSVRRLATVIRRDAQGDFTIPTVNDIDNEGVQIVPNESGVSEVDPEYGQLVLPTIFFYSRPITASIRLVEDAPLFVSSLARLLGERIARVQLREFTTGVSGGVLPSAAIGVTAASATAITIDELIDLIASIDAAYRTNSTLMLNATLLATLQKTKDGGGNYLWKSSGLAEVPTVTNPRMPATITASARTVLFGDFSRYMIRDLGKFRIMRGDETKVELQQVQFHGYLTSGGGLLDSNAIKCIQQAAS